MTESQFDTLVADSRDRQRLSLGANVFDAAVRWPLGGGQLRYVRVRPFPGVTALYCDFKLKQDIEVTLEPRDELLVSYFLSGSLSGTTVGAKAGSDPLHFRPAHTMVRLPNWNGGYAIQIPAASEHRFVQLRLDRQRLMDWLKSSRSSMPRHLQQTLMIKEPRVLCNAAWTARTRASLVELMGGSASDALFAPRFFGKAVELMTLFSLEIDSLMKPARSRASGSREEDERERVIAACRLINAQPASHWSVGALAAAVQWNATSMQTGFQRHAGTSVHRYVRQQRMALAGRLLRETRLQISQVAAECGWRCGSRFAEAFFGSFGESPSAYRESVPRSGESSPRPSA